MKLKSNCISFLKLSVHRIKTCMCRTLGKIQTRVTSNRQQAIGNMRYHITCTFTSVPSFFNQRCLKLILQDFEVTVYDVSCYRYLSDRIMIGIQSYYEECMLDKIELRQGLLGFHSHFCSLSHQYLHFSRVTVLTF